MEFFKADLIGLVQYLLPGFLSTWIFHSLTAHPKASPFERVVQALIFTAFTTLLVYLVRWGAFQARRCVGSGRIVEQRSRVCLVGLHCRFSRSFIFVVRQHEHSSSVPPKFGNYEKDFFPLRVVQCVQRSWQRDGLIIRRLTFEGRKASTDIRRSGRMARSS